MTMVNDPEILAFIRKTGKLYPPDTDPASTEEIRRVYDALCRGFKADRPAGVSVEDSRIGPVPIRRYKPADPTGNAVALYLHGGGFVVGGLDSHDDICADICAETGLETIAVAYRLSPEHRYPAQLDDVEIVWRSIAETRPGIVIGDSAGGTLAAALCFRMRRLNGPMPAGQVLIYPGLGIDPTLPSYIDNAEAPMLRTDEVAQYLHHYVGGDLAQLQNDPEAVPLTAQDYTGLPSAFIVTADIDPIRDDGKLFADRLTAAGVDAVYRNEPQLVHAYLRARHSSRRARDSFAEICRRIAGFANS
ncbi:alpha/beta hydrolase [Pacificispira spongiicola]|nr:alpha/beta hydrolase [Pacificispira spongiicola]